MYIKDECKRLLFFKFRVGVSPLRVETGRYESCVDVLTGQARKGLVYECRTCLCCFRGVENEQHFLLECPLYEQQRSTLIHAFRAYCSKQRKLVPQQVDQLFNSVMSCVDKHVIYALANYLWLSFSCRTAFLGN